MPGRFVLSSRTSSSAGQAHLVGVGSSDKGGLHLQPVGANIQHEQCQEGRIAGRKQHAQNGQKPRRGQPAGADLWSAALNQATVTRHTRRGMLILQLVKYHQSHVAHKLHSLPASGLVIGQGPPISDHVQDDAQGGGLVEHTSKPPIQLVADKAATRCCACWSLSTLNLCYRREVSQSLQQSSIPAEATPKGCSMLLSQQKSAW